MKQENNIETDQRVLFFDQLSERWDSDEQNPGETIARLNAALDLLGFQKDQEILEVGCGTGQVTAWLTGLFQPKHVTAIDFSQKMIARARSKNIPADFRCLDVCRDELPAGEFDIIFCFHSFPHFRNKAFAMQNFGRALKPGGSFIVMHLAGSEQINHFHDHVGGAVAGDHLPSEMVWPSLLNRAGLTQQTYIDRADLFFLKATK